MRRIEGRSVWHGGEGGFDGTIEVELTDRNEARVRIESERDEDNAVEIYLTIPDLARLSEQAGILADNAATELEESSS